FQLREERVLAGLEPLPADLEWHLRLQRRRDVGARAPEGSGGVDLLPVVRAFSEDVRAAPEHRASVGDLDPLASGIRALTVFVGRAPLSGDLRRGDSRRRERTAFLSGSDGGETENRDR